MKSLYLVRYRMKGESRISLVVTFSHSLSEALKEFHRRMGRMGFAFDQYEHLSHREIPERHFEWVPHGEFLRQLPHNDLLEFLRQRQQRQVSELGKPDTTTLTLLEHLEPPSQPPTHQNAANALKTSGLGSG